MQCFIVLLSVFLLINTIGAPPVVEKPAKDQEKIESKTNETDDEVVRRDVYVC